MPPMLSGHRERLRTGPSEDRARDEVEYQQILEAKTEVLECVPLPPSTIRCDVAYANALNQAVRKAPAVMSQQFGVEDGRLLFVAGPYLEDETLTASFRAPPTSCFLPNIRPPCRGAQLPATHLRRVQAGSSRGLGVMAPD